MRALTLAALLAVSTQSALVAVPRPAHAIVGLGTGLAGVAISGLIPMFVSIWAPMYFNESTEAGNRNAVYVFTGLMGLGILLLDQDAEGGARLAPVRSDLAHKAGVSEAELDAYHRDLDELNATLETVVQELSRLPRPSVADATALWKRLGSALDPAALSAAAKLSARAARAEASSGT